jgi:glycosyltransferase involved in cell wall biosynthesis
MLLVPSLKGGGSERVIVNLAKYLSRDKFDIELVVINFNGVYNDELPTDISIKDLKSKRTIKSFLPLYHHIKKSKPNIILSTGPQLNLMLLIMKSFINKRINIVVREGSIVSENLKKNQKIFSFLYKRLYNKAHLIICQSNYMAEDLIKNFNVKKSLIKIIRNPVDIERIERLYSNSNNPYTPYNSEKTINILTVGRLSDEKNHSYLIKTFYNNFKNNSNVKLFIMGEGVLKEKLQLQIKNIEMEDRIYIIGFKKNPYIWMRHANLFVLASKYEGLPNVLLEALACSVPVLVNTHPGGTSEIMKIVNLEDRIVKELEFNENIFNNLSDETKQLLIRNFDKNKVLKIYEENLIKLVK